MAVKETINQINDQTRIKTGASCTDRELMAFDKETSLGVLMSDLFSKVHGIYNYIYFYKHKLLHN